MLSKFVLVFFITVLLVAIAVPISKKSSSSREFLSPFECGFAPSATSKMNFSSRFFIMALIFLIFDVEVILLFPFLAASATAGLYSTLLMVGFVNILSLGLYYEWNFSMMEWMV